jgi:hypothetical protein
VHEFVLRDTLFHYFPASGNFRGRERERERERREEERESGYLGFTHKIFSFNMF